MQRREKCTSFFLSFIQRDKNSVENTHTKKRCMKEPKEKHAPRATSSAPTCNRIRISKLIHFIILGDFIYIQFHSVCFFIAPFSLFLVVVTNESATNSSATTYSLLATSDRSKLVLLIRSKQSWTVRHSLVDKYELFMKCGPFGRVAPWASAEWKCWRILQVATTTTPSFGRCSCSCVCVAIFFFAFLSNIMCGIIMRFFLSEQKEILRASLNY